MRRCVWSRRTQVRQPWACKRACLAVAPAPFVTWVYVIYHVGGPDRGQIRVFLEHVHPLLCRNDSLSPRILQLCRPGQKQCRRVANRDLRDLQSSSQTTQSQQRNMTNLKPYIHNLTSLPRVYTGNQKTRNTELLLTNRERMDRCKHQKRQFTSKKEWWHRVMWTSGSQEHRAAPALHGQPSNVQSPPKGSMESSFLFIAGGARPGMSLMLLLCGLTICEKGRPGYWLYSVENLMENGVERQGPKWLTEKRWAGYQNKDKSVCLGAVSASLFARGGNCNTIQISNHSRSSLD